MINPLLEKGQMPNLERLINAGVMGNVAALKRPVDEGHRSADGPSFRLESATSTVNGAIDVGCRSGHCKRTVDA